MVAKFIVVLSLAVAASAIPLVPVKVAYEHEAPAHYQFEYSVHDTHTGDIKQQKEAREGDNVHGSYSLVQPDGVTRIVDYTASKEQGFNAQVRYEGHPTEGPKVAYAPVQKIAYAPVQKVAYAAAPVQTIHYAAPKISYAAPAKVTYAQAPVQTIHYAAPAKVAYAPVAKVAYTAPLSHVTFSSPAISYHH